MVRFVYKKSQSLEIVLWRNSKVDFYEVIRTRRSVRSFKEDPIPKEVLDKVLEAARIAPSGGNRHNPGSSS